MYRIVQNWNEGGQILVSVQQSDEWNKTWLTCFIELCHGGSQNLLHFAMTQSDTEVIRRAGMACLVSWLDYGLYNRGIEVRFQARASDSFILHVAQAHRRQIRWMRRYRRWSRRDAKAITISRTEFCWFFFLNQQSEYNVFHRLMSWQESSLWTVWRDEFLSSEISYSWLKVSRTSSFQSPWDISNSW